LKRGILIAITLLVFVTVWLAFATSRPAEPAWAGHPLSEWLDAYDTNLRFPDDNPPRSGFSDLEIEKALDAIKAPALPCLVHWLQIKNQDKWRWKVYFWLNRTHLSRLLTFQPQTPNLQGLAISGFMYYGTNALPVFSEVEALTHSQNNGLRLAAYEAAFFSRPPKELFLPLADRIFKEEPPEYQAMAAQWVAERFPDEAEKRGLRGSYRQFFHDQTHNPHP